MNQYVYHKDWTNNTWNIYEVVNGRENFIKQVQTLDEAQDFCDINNGVPQIIGR